MTKMALSFITLLLYNWMLKIFFFVSIVLLYIVCRGLPTLGPADLTTLCRHGRTMVLNRESRLYEIIESGTPYVSNCFGRYLIVSRHDSGTNPSHYLMGDFRALHIQRCLTRV